MKGEREEVLARRLDWALGEAVGGERAPDVTQAVLARHAAGFDVEVEAPAEPRVRWWLVAALVLFGVVAVAAVFQLERGASTPSFAEVPEVEAPEVEAPAEDVVVVTTREGIAALPVEARAVELRDLDDAAVAALVARCPRLQHLRIFASTAYRYGEAVTEPVSITDAALAHVAKLMELRRLDLVGTDRVRGPGLSRLQGLPLLTDLTLSHFDLDDVALQFLPRLPSLRALDLTQNHGFGLPSESETGSQGVAAIARCPGLVRLTMHACSQVHADALRQLGALRGLVELDLSGGQYHRGYGANSHAASSRDDAEKVVTAREQFGAGVRDEVIADWPKLRVLRLGSSALLTSAVGKRLRELCPRLVTLDLSDCPGIDDATVTAVLGLAKLRALDLSRCGGITPAVVPLLRSSTLYELTLDETPWLTLEDIETLFASGKRVKSARQGDAAFEAGMQALAIKYSPRLAARTEQVHSLADIEALPDDLAELEVDVRGLGDDAARLLARRPTLRRVAFVRSEGRMPLSDAGLGALAKLPHLQTLELVGADGVSGEGLRRLLACRELESLRCAGMKLDDAALELLPRFPALRRLDLTGTRTFGARGLAAVAACAGLRDLVLMGCAQLEPDWLAGLGTLTALTRLDLTRTGGVTDAALAGLRPLTELRELRLAEGNVTATGALAFAGMPKLTTLDLSDNAGLTTAALQHLPASLEVLALDRCLALDAEAAAFLLLRAPGLRSLSVSRAEWLFDPALAAILSLPRLEILDVSACTHPTKASLPALRAAKALRVLDASHCLWLDDALADELKAARPDLEVRRRIW